jgi:hypothetical protein
MARADILTKENSLPSGRRKMANGNSTAKYGTAISTPIRSKLIKHQISEFTFLPNQIKSKNNLLYFYQSVPVGIHIKN